MTNTTINRRRFVAHAAATSLLFAGAAGAQSYPSKPVRLIVGFQAGGPTDVFARGIAEGLSKLWGHQVVVDNRPGASEIIGADIAAKAAPDGYTILLGADTVLSQNQFLFNKLPYQPEVDLKPISRLIDANFVLMVRADLPVKNLADFVALMKRDGPNRSYGSGGRGTVPQLAMESFKREAGFNILEVPYAAGMAPIVMGVLSGTIDCAFGAAAAAIPQLGTGKMKVLAISGDKRVPPLPDVPTFAQAGYPNVRAGFYMGLSAPRAIPDAIASKIAADTRRVITEKAFVEKYVNPNGYTVVASSPEEFDEFLKTDRESMKRRFLALGITPE